MLGLAMSDIHLNTQQTRSVTNAVDEYLDRRVIKQANLFERKENRIAETKAAVENFLDDVSHLLCLLLLYE